jgi:ribokinase
MNGKIVVVGSMNTDITIKMERFPSRGETILGNDYQKSQGGKGANQAVAAVKAGADVTFIAKSGNDEFRSEAIKGYKQAGINTDHIFADEKGKTGLALIWVDAHGENSIVVASGANKNLTPEEITSKADIIKAADILILQLEIPLDTVKKAVEIANENDVVIILNPAPAFELSDDILGKINIITPNLVELQKLTGIKIENEKDIKEACEFLRNKGIKDVIVTCGKKGAYILNDEGFEHIQPFKVSAVDTTAAGDVLNGALAAAIVNNKPIKEALVFANAAAAISVTQMGAQPSAPVKVQIEEFMSKGQLSFTN